MAVKIDRVKEVTINGTRYRVSLLHMDYWEPLREFSRTAGSQVLGLIEGMDLSKQKFSIEDLPLDVVGEGVQRILELFTHQKLMEDVALFGAHSEYWDDQRQMWNRVDAMPGGIKEYFSFDGRADLLKFLFEFYKHNLAGFIAGSKSPAGL